MGYRRRIRPHHKLGKDRHQRRGKRYQGFSRHRRRLKMYTRAAARLHLKRSCRSSICVENHCPTRSLCTIGQSSQIPYSMPHPAKLPCHVDLGQISHISRIHFKAFAQLALQFRRITTHEKHGSGNNVGHKNHNRGKYKYVPGNDPAERKHYGA